MCSCCMLLRVIQQASKYVNCNAFYTQIALSPKFTMNVQFKGDNAHKNALAKVIRKTHVIGTQTHIY